MKSQIQNQGKLKELKVNIEEKVVDNLKAMALKTGIPSKTMSSLPSNATRPATATTSVLSPIKNRGIAFVW